MGSMRWVTALVVVASFGRSSGASLLVEESAHLSEASAGSNNIFQAQIQLQQYSNPTGSLPMVQGYNVTCLNPKIANGGGKCNFMVTTTLTIFGGKSFPMGGGTSFQTSTGIVKLSSVSPTWKSMQSANAAMKPLSLVVNIFHLGNVYPIPVTPFGQIIPSTPVLVDSFVVNMAAVLPLTSSYSPTGGFSTTTVQGQLRNTSLTIKYALRCLNNGVMYDCNVFCSKPANVGQKAKCSMQLNNGHNGTIPLVCTPASTKNSPDPNQYQSCVYCPFGATVTSSGAKCKQQPSGPSGTQSPVGGVPASYKSATTALAIMFVIAGLIVIGLVIRMYMTKKKADEAEYIRRRNAWQEKPKVDLSSGDNKAFNHRPDPDASYSETDTSDSQSQTSSQASSAVSGSKGSIVVGIPGGIPPHPDSSHHSSRRPSDAPSHDESHPRTASQSTDHGRTTPRIEARV